MFQAVDPLLQAIYLILLAYEDYAHVVNDALQCSVAFGHEFATFGDVYHRLLQAINFALQCLYLGIGSLLSRAGQRQE